MLGRQIISKYWKEVGYVEFYAIGAFVRDRLVNKYICINGVCDVEVPRLVRTLGDLEKPSPIIDRVYSEGTEFKLTRIVLNSEGLEIVEESAYYVYDYLVNGILMHHRDGKRAPAMPWRMVARPRGFVRVQGEVILDEYASAALIYKLFKAITRRNEVRVSNKLKIVDTPQADSWGRITYDDRGFLAREKVLIENGRVQRDFRGMMRRGFGELRPTPRNLYAVPLSEDVMGKHIITYANGKFYLWRGNDGPYETRIDVKALENVDAVGSEVRFERIIDGRGIPISVGSPKLRVVIE